MKVFLPQEPACFVSTHLDDVALSCGCYLFEHPGTPVVTIMAGAPKIRREDGWNAWTTGKSFAPDAVRVRRSEDAAAMRTLGARPTWLEFWDLQYIDGEEQDAHAIARSLADVFAGLAAASLVGPLGLQHPDHRAVSDACLEFARTSALDLYLYLDMPYAQKHPGAAEARLAELLERELTVQPLDPVAANKRAKKRAVSQYKSQCARMHYTKLDDVLSAAEQYWRVTSGRAGPAGRVGDEQAPHSRSSMPGGPNRCPMTCLVERQGHRTKHRVNIGKGGLVDVRKTLRRSDTLVGLKRDLKKLSTKLTRPVPESEELLFDRYLASHNVRKLQIGSGSNALPGWLNTDAIPRCEGGIRLDVRDAFPFSAGTFDYVFSEAMIYQFSWHEGISIMRECRRVLKPGGTLRVAVADLEVLIGLYVNPDDPGNRRFVEWAAERFPGVCRPMPAFVLNNHFRAWSAQFLYDGELMELAMREAGFTHIVRCAVGESDDVNLRGIESHGKASHAEEMVAFETMVFEARCPS